MFPVKNRKSEHHHSSLHIGTSLGAKFQLKLTVYFFFTKFAQKGYFWTKTEKSHLRVHPWLLLTILNFPRGRQTQRYFNVSSPSNLIDRKHLKILFNNKNTLSKVYYLHLKQQSMTQVT